MNNMFNNMSKTTGKLVVKCPYCGTSSSDLTKEVATIIKQGKTTISQVVVLCPACKKSYSFVIPKNENV